MLVLARVWRFESSSGHQSIVSDSPETSKKPAKAGFFVEKWQYFSLGVHMRLQTGKMMNFSSSIRSISAIPSSGRLEASQFNAATARNRLLGASKGSGACTE